MHVLPALLRIKNICREYMEKRRARSHKIKGYAQRYRIIFALRYRSRGVKARHKIFVRLIPVNNIKPIVNIIGAHIVVLEIISVLPNIDGQNRAETPRQGRILIGGGDDFKIASAVNGQPRVS